MHKNLNIKQWMQVLGEHERKDISKALILYIKFKPRNYNSNWWKQNIKYIIRKKKFLLDNYGMSTLKKKKISRSKKIDNSDIGGLIDQMSEIQKREIIEIWIKEKREKEKSNRVESKYK